MTARYQKKGAGPRRRTALQEKREGPDLEEGPNGSQEDHPWKVTSLALNREHHLGVRRSLFPEFAVGRLRWPRGRLEPRTSFQRSNWGPSHLSCSLGWSCQDPTLTTDGTVPFSGLSGAFSIHFLIPRLPQCCRGLPSRWCSLRQKEPKNATWQIYKAHGE